VFGQALPQLLELLDLEQLEMDGWLRGESPQDGRDRILGGKVVSSPGFCSASLDHTMWFNRPFRVDEWLRFEQDSPVSDHSRGFARCAFHTREGVRVASCNRGA